MNVQLRTENSTENPLETCLLAARGDYMNDSLVDTSIEEAMQGTEKDKRELTRDLLRKGHWGVFEHAQAFFAIEGISVVTERQLTRHRHLSFDVQSMRYVNVSDADVYVPETMQECGGTFPQPAEQHTSPSGAGDAYCSWTDWLFIVYERMVEAGVPEEDARYVLPLGTKLNCTMSGNIRALLHVLDLRDSGAAQSEIQKLSKKLIGELRDWCPVVVEEWESHVKNASLQSP